MCIFLILLDIDFLMLEKYEKFYKNILEKNEGPEIKIDEHMKKLRILVMMKKSNQIFPR